MKNQAILITIVFIIGYLVILCMSGCTMKLVRSEEGFDQLEKYRYLTIESYKEGLVDAIEAYEYKEQKNEPELLPWEAE